MKAKNAEIVTGSTRPTATCHGVWLKRLQCGEADCHARLGKWSYLPIGMESRAPKREYLYVAKQGANEQSKS
jgi:hypothetical protein